MKIVQWLGGLEGHFGYKIYKLDNGKCLRVSVDDRETYDGWYCDEMGISDGSPDVSLNGVYEVVERDDDGEPIQWDLVGFEER